MVGVCLLVLATCSLLETYGQAAGVSDDKTGEPRGGTIPRAERANLKLKLS